MNDTPESAHLDPPLSSLFASSTPTDLPIDGVVQETARLWQQLGDTADFQEMTAVLAGAEQKRMYVVIGRIAAAGEQLAVAGAALRDARAWAESGAVESTGRIAGRALGEIVGYFALSAAHGLANVTARLLALELQSRAILAQREKASRGFPPFDPSDSGWLAFNAKTVQSLDAATVHHQPPVQQLVGILQTLVIDESWSALVERRHNDFHRWRPQSVEGGVEPSSPWMIFEDVQVLSAFDRGSLVPEELGDSVAMAERGLSALELAMREWLELFDAAKHGVMTYVLAKHIADQDLDYRVDPQEGGKLKSP